MGKNVLPSLAQIIKKTQESAAHANAFAPFDTLSRLAIINLIKKDRALFTFSILFLCMKTSHTGTR